MSKATTSADPDWQIVMAPAKGGLWFVLLLVWAFTAGVYILWKFANGEVSPFGHLLIFAFPVLITYYGLRGIQGNNGKLVLRQDGFTLTLPSSENESFRWERVDSFETRIFGDPVATGAGVATAGFVYDDGKKGQRVIGLANSLPYAGQDLARLMDYARIEAAKGWPDRPQDLNDLAVAALGSDRKTSARDRFKARSTTSRGS
ncbi:hypothetical protein [Pelagibacterium sediminicola]|uniref:hypothetical protein n=1 Tax=Pelagibacterium sediminicola TaxID=2248761 RepID=UPI000E320F61|nr:hypothetical protein [Pelagibacterium sediminicola]